MITNKIKIGLIFNTKETAADFINQNILNGTFIRHFASELVYETPLERFIWIKPFSTFRGYKLNFVFTTKDIRDTKWFDEVIRSMLVCGTGTIGKIQ